MSSHLPVINAALNATSATLLCTALAMIKTGRRRAHGWLMVCATAVSAAFLVCYLAHQYLDGPKSTQAAPGWLRRVYFLVLFPHMTLAVVMLPMIFLTLWRAYRRDWTSHRRISGKTLWIWLYVSVTGVIVYLMLYHTRLAG